MTDTPMTTLTT